RHLDRRTADLEGADVEPDGVEAARARVDELATRQVAREGASVDQHLALAGTYSFGHDPRVVPLAADTDDVDEHLAAGKHLGPAMNQLSLRRADPGDCSRSAALGRDPQDRRVDIGSEIDETVIRPDRAAETGRVGQVDRRATGDGDLLDLRPGSESDP